MGHVLGAIPRAEDARLLAGFDHAEDAAVYRLDDDRAVVVTIDVITPLVDDPFLFGEIAAANALSDLYAVGGDGLFSLGFLGLPPGFPIQSGAEIAKGGATLAKEAGAPVVGGHSVESHELMYGLVVVGEAHPDRLFRNDAASPGDQLVLTKPIGTGVLTTALKAGALREAEEAVAGMRMSNRAAVEPMRAHGVRAATDVTGFGLLGHAAEMAKASNVAITIEGELVPSYPRAQELLDRGFRTRGNESNPDYVRELLPFEGKPPELFYDPQTSGGLLVAVSRDRLESLVDALRAVGYDSVARVGEIENGLGLRVR